MKDRETTPPFAHLDRYFTRAQTIESLTTLATNLQVRPALGPLAVGLAASVVGEGTTTLALYLARQVSRTFEIPTLVVEANFRRPALADYCGIQSNGGLKELLTNHDSNLDDLAQRIHSTNVWALPAGGAHQSPLGLIDSPRFAALLNRANKRYRFVFVDAPPILHCAESAVILKAMDRTALVVRSSSTTREAAAKTIQLLKDHGSRIDGMILNRRRFFFG